MNKIHLNKPVFLVFGAAGVGKTSILKRVAAVPELQVLRVVTCTTRAPRPNEVNGVDYEFLSKQEFLAKTTSGNPIDGFLEWTEFNGNYYGTPAAPLYTPWAKGFMLALDMKGVQKLHSTFTDNAFLVRIFVKNYECLQKRMSSRKLSNTEILAREKEDLAQLEILKTLAIAIDLEIENVNLVQSAQKLKEFILSKIVQKNKV